MKFNALVMHVATVAAIATAVPTAAQAQLWYNGNFTGDANGGNGLASEVNTEVALAMSYDNFQVTGAGWTITSVFGDFLSNTVWSTANYEIRTGVSEANGGTLLFSGTGLATTRVATGRSGFGYTEYRATIAGLSIFLNPGTYWLGISPVGDQTGRAFVSTTTGTNGINSVLDQVSFQTFPPNSFYFSSQNGAYDLAYGVDGDNGTGQEVVPEPATMTLLATGLAGMAAARRRKAAKA